MKLKFKQSIATAEVTYNCNEEYEVKNEKQAESFIEAGFAEKVEVVSEKKDVEPKEEKTVAKKTRKPAKKKEVDAE